MNVAADFSVFAQEVKSLRRFIKLKDVKLKCITAKPFDWGIHEMGLIELQYFKNYQVSKKKPGAMLIARPTMG